MQTREWMSENPTVWFLALGDPPCFLLFLLGGYRWVGFDFSSTVVCLALTCKLITDTPHGVFLRRPK